MKMIYVAPLTTKPDRDSGWVSSLEKLGWEVIPYSSFIKYPNSNIFTRVFYKVCNRLNIGSRNNEMQKILVLLMKQEKPDWIHFRMPLGFDKKTINTFRSENVVITEYFNDDAFSKKQPFGFYWKFHRIFKMFDGHFVWRKRDVEIYYKAGATYVDHSPPWYDPDKTFISDDFEVPLNFLADVAFIGHWENDWRVDCLQALSAKGFDVILKGGGDLWDDAIKDTQLNYLSPVVHAFGAEYNYIYSNVVAGLCFFSKINNDSWTRRALEIIAVGGVLVCERTEEAETYFVDREEAFFFSSIDELVAIVGEIKVNLKLREKVRLGGKARLLKSEVTIFNRAETIHKFVEKQIKKIKI